MERHETDADEVVTRLRSLGSAPIDEALAAEHLAAMQTAGVSTPNRWRRYATAGAATVALLAGSSSLAAAGVLPDAAQGIAHDILDTVGVDVPDQARGACVSTIAAGDEVPPGDGHGDAVSQAAREDCAPDASADDSDGGPPDGVTTGPPTTTPVGPPDGVPNGPPDGVPNGPPDGVPNGPPDGVPQRPTRRSPQRATGRRAQRATLGSPQRATRWRAPRPAGRSPQRATLGSPQRATGWRAQRPARRGPQRATRRRSGRTPLSDGPTLHA